MWGQLEKIQVRKPNSLRTDFLALDDTLSNSALQSLSGFLLVAVVAGAVEEAVASLEGSDDGVSAGGLGDFPQSKAELQSRVIINYHYTLSLSVRDVPNDWHLRCGGRAGGLTWRVSSTTHFDPIERDDRFRDYPNY